MPPRVWPPEERPLERLITAKAWQREAQGICINSGKQANDEGFELQSSLNFLSDIFLCEENIFIYIFFSILLRAG